MSLAILCPGQGGQHPGMFDIVAGVPSAEAILNRVREQLPAPPEELFTTTAKAFQNRIAQPLVCAAILARWQAIRNRLPAPRIVFGYSVGELAAHAIAGTLTEEDCLSLADRRAELMDAASPSDCGMTAVLGLDKDRLAGLCAEHNAAIAIENNCSHFLVGGALADLAQLEQAAKFFGAHTTKVKVSVPAHTPLMASAADAFREELTRAELRSPTLPILAGIDGRLVCEAAEARETLAAQIAQTVQWRQCVTQAVERGATVLLELGPGNALTQIARELYPDCPVRSLDEFHSLDGLQVWVERMLER